MFLADVQDVAGFLEYVCARNWPELANFTSPVSCHTSYQLILSLSSVWCIYLGFYISRVAILDDESWSRPSSLFLLFRLLSRDTDQLTQVMLGVHQSVSLCLTDDVRMPPNVSRRYEVASIAERTRSRMRANSGRLTAQRLTHVHVKHAYPGKNVLW